MCPSILFIRIRGSHNQKVTGSTKSLQRKKGVCASARKSNTEPEILIPELQSGSPKEPQMCFIHLLCGPTQGWHSQYFKKEALAKNYNFIL